MKSISRILCFVTVAFCFGPLLYGGPFDLEIHCIPKRVDQNAKMAGDGGAAVTKEHWAYEVTVENRTFKEMDNLDVKYIIFFNQEQLGVKAAATSRRQNGGFTIAALKPHEKKVFTTDSVELSKSHLVGNWIYHSGAKPNATDTLSGLWVRAYQADQLLSDYANPSTLKIQQKWE